MSTAPIVVDPSQVQSIAVDPSQVSAMPSTQPQPQQWPITPQEGESFADTMKRAVAAGKNVTQSQIDTSEKEAIKKVPTVLAASFLAGPAMLGGLIAAPEAASGALGGGAMGGAAGGATGGASTELINKGLHAAAGENVLNQQSAKDIGTSALLGGVAGGAMGLFGKVINSLANTKLARGMINESLGATARDVTYGNPAKAMLDENIKTPLTGDIEKYKAALRQGMPSEQALVAAGGRAGAVAQKISQLSPQVDQLLGQSAASIPVTDVIDKPLMNVASDIMGNRAMTEAEKDAALTQIGALQKSLKEGLPDTINPLQANQIKQAIGNRINWGGNIAVTDEVKPAYRAVYGTLKQSVNNAVPEVAPVNERLSNLLSAQTDLEKLMKAEEVGQGKGALGSAVTGIARRAEAVMGRGIPTMSAATRPTITNSSSGPIGAAAGLARLSDLLGTGNNQ